MDCSINGTMTLESAFRKYEKKGYLSTDEVALYYGYVKDQDGRYIDRWEQMPFDRLPDELKRLRVSGSKWERSFGCKYCFIERGQLCVGCEENPLRR